MVFNQASTIGYMPAALNTCYQIPVLLVSKMGTIQNRESTML